MDSALAGCRVCLSSSRKGIELFDSSNAEYLSILNWILETTLTQVPETLSKLCNGCKRTVDDVQKLRGSFQKTQDSIGQFAIPAQVTEDTVDETPEEEFVEQIEIIEYGDSTKWDSGDYSDGLVEEEESPASKSKDEQPDVEWSPPAKLQRKKRGKKVTKPAAKTPPGGYGAMRERKAPLEKLMKELGLLYCDFCKEQFSEFLPLIKHMVKVHNNVGYIVCCDRHYNRTRAFEHMEYHQNNDAYKCQFCGKVCLSKDALERHSDSAHPAEEQQIYQCDICDKRFVKVFLLNIHKKTHTAKVDRPYPCPKCPYAAPTPSCLKLHVNAVHENIVTDYCDVCGKGFKTKGDCRKHVNQVHGEKTAEKCENCGNLVLNLKRHMKRCMAEKVNCNICGKSVAPNHLKYHTQTSHTDRTFNCSLCTKVFKHKPNLDEHINFIHKGIRVPCLFCDASASSTKNNVQHMKMRHSKEYEEYRAKKKEEKLSRSQVSDADETL